MSKLEKIDSRVCLLPLTITEIIIKCWSRATEVVILQKIHIDVLLLLGAVNTKKNYLLNDAFCPWTYLVNFKGETTASSSPTAPPHSSPTPAVPPGEAGAAAPRAPRPWGTPLSRCVPRLRRWRFRTKGLYGVPVPRSAFAPQGRCHFWGQDGVTPPSKTRARSGERLEGVDGGVPLPGRRLVPQAQRCPREPRPRLALGLPAAEQPGREATGGSASGTGLPGGRKGKPRPAGKSQRQRIRLLPSRVIWGGRKSPRGWLGSGAVPLSRATYPWSSRQAGQPWAGNPGKHVSVGLLLCFKMQRLAAWLAFCLQVWMERRLTFSFSVWFPRLGSWKGNPRRERRKKRGFPSFNIHQIYPVIALQGAACVEHYEHRSMQMTEAWKSPGKNKSVGVQMFPINIVVQPWWLRWEDTGLKIPTATPPLLNLSPHTSLSSLN